MKEKAAKVDIRNRRASHDYEFIDTYTAGIVLAGTEIKSVRAGKASLSDSYCYFNSGELYVRNMHITEYFWASYNRKDPKRDRKLLLQRRELNKLERQIKERGLTIVPVRLFVASNGYAKVEIALCRGKKEYDKRQSIKEKDMQRASQRGEDY